MLIYTIIVLLFTGMIAYLVIRKLTDAKKIVRPDNPEIFHLVSNLGILSFGLAWIPTFFIIWIMMTEPGGPGMALLVLPFIILLMGVLPSFGLGFATYKILKKSASRGEAIHRYKRWVFVYGALLVVAFLTRFI